MAPEAVGTGGARLPEYAKLDLHEFKELEDFPAIRRAIDSRLSSDGLLHYFNDDEQGRTWLVFRTADAPGVSAGFDALAGDARKAGERAAAQIRECSSHDREATRDEEPLVERAARVREACVAQAEGQAHEHVPELTHHMDKARAIAYVKQRLAWMDKEVIDEQMAAVKRGYDFEILPSELKYSKAEAEDLLDHLQNKNQRLFSYTGLVHTYADTAAELDDQVMGIDRRRHQQVDVRRAARHLQLDLLRPGERPGLDRRRRRPLEAVRPDARHRRRDHAPRHEVGASASAGIVDTVEYSGLVPGLEYEVTGTLVDRETGEPVTGADGTKVEASATFTPEATEGTVEVTFVFDASALAGHDVVAFETVTHEGRVVATHGGEDAPEVLRVPCDSTCDVDPRADVGDPGVAAPPRHLGLLAPDVDPLVVRARTRPSCVGMLRIDSAVEVGEAHLARDRLEQSVEGAGVGVLQAPARSQVGVVHDDVGVGDVALVVVVVDDGDLEVGEALSRPSGREPPQAVECDAVPGVGGDDVVLVGARVPAPPGCVVALGGATRVHADEPPQAPRELGPLLLADALQGALHRRGGGAGRGRLYRHQER